MPIERKLTAIVFTDIAGFTELSAQDEENAFALIETQRNVLKPIVKGHGGQWLKEIGDGLLLSFPSSIQAVNCAIAIQDAVSTIDNLTLRIGIHQGDILQKDDDIFGDDVNIASRIQEYAPINGIAISQKVEADISSHPKYQTKYIDQLLLVYEDSVQIVEIKSGFVKNTISSALQLIKVDNARWLVSIFWPICSSRKAMG